MFLRASNSLIPSPLLRVKTHLNPRWFSTIYSQRIKLTGKFLSSKCYLYVPVSKVTIFIYIFCVKTKLSTRKSCYLFSRLREVGNKTKHKKTQRWWHCFMRHHLLKNTLTLARASAEPHRMGNRIFIQHHDNDVTTALYFMVTWSKFYLSLRAKNACVFFGEIAVREYSGKKWKSNKIYINIAARGRAFDSTVFHPACCN